MMNMMEFTLIVIVFKLTVAGLLWFFLEGRKSSDN